MAIESFNNSKEVAGFIKKRRLELELTIEEAAERAGLGTKTWSRYEAGNPIRKDKIKGVLRALKWKVFPTDDGSNITKQTLVKEYKNHNAWSEFLYEHFGLYAAISFIFGSDILSDYISDDLEELSKLPKGSHIGQLEFSMLSIVLPKEYLMEYDYNFLYSFNKSIQNLINQISSEDNFVAHKVIDEISLYLIVKEAEILMEEIGDRLSEHDAKTFAHWDEWIFDIFDDMDVETFLFSDLSLFAPEAYQFDNWFKDQFYL